MKTVSQLTELIEEKRCEIDKIVDKATREERELTKDEQTRVDHVLDHEIPELKSQLETRAKFEEQLKERAIMKLGSQLGSLPGASTRIQPNGRDAFGQPIFCLSPDQKVADTLETRWDIEHGFGEFIKAAVCGVNKYTPPEIKNALSTQVGGSGGFLVPEQLSAEIVDKARAKAVMLRAGCSTVPMNGPTLAVAAIQTDPTFEVKAENAKFTGTSTVFKQHSLNAVTFGNVETMSMELLQDGINAAEMITEVGVRALATQLDALAINGTGSGEPTGLLNTSTIDGTSVGGNLTWQGLADAAKEVRLANHEPNFAILNPDESHTLTTATSGDGVSSAELWQGKPPALENVSLLDSTNCPDNELIVGDFSKALWGVRLAPRVEISYDADEAFERYQCKIRFVWRGDFTHVDGTAFHKLTNIS